MSDKIENPKIVSTQLSLCEILGIDRTTLQEWFKRPGAPPRRKDNRYVVAEWEAYKLQTKAAQQRHLRSKTMDLKEQKLAMEVETQRIQLMKAAGELIPIEWTKKLLDHLILTIRTIIHEEAKLTPVQKEALTQSIEKIKCEYHLQQLIGGHTDTLGENIAEPSCGKLDEDTASAENID